MCVPTSGGHRLPCALTCGLLHTDVKFLCFGGQFLSFGPTVVLRVSGRGLATGAGGSVSGSVRKWATPGGYRQAGFRQPLTSRMASAATFHLVNDTHDRAASAVTNCPALCHMMLCGTAHHLSPQHSAAVQPSVIATQHHALYCNTTGSAIQRTAVGCRGSGNAVMVGV